MTDEDMVLQAGRLALERRALKEKVRDLQEEALEIIQALEVTVEVIKIDGACMTGRNHVGVKDGPNRTGLSPSRNGGLPTRGMSIHRPRRSRRTSESLMRLGGASQRYESFSGTNSPSSSSRPQVSEALG